MEFELILSSLKKCEALASLSDTHRGLMLLLSKPKNFSPGTDIFTTGNLEPDEFCLIVSGQADILKGQEVQFSRGQGTLLGEISLVTKNTGRTRTVRAGQDFSCLVWSAKTLEQASHDLYSNLQGAFESAAFERLAQDI